MQMQQERILRFVQRSRKPVTSDDVATGLGMAWQTAHTKLMLLAHQKNSSSENRQAASLHNA